MYKYLDPIFDEIVESHRIIDHLHSIHNSSHTKEQVTFIVVDIYLDMLGVYISAIIEAGFYGGLDTWPIADHFHACLQTGGIPVGWVGALPDNGGVPKECMQLLHYGPQTSK